MNSIDPLATVTLSMKKAFHSIEKETIMRTIGINETYGTILEDIYTGTTVRVHNMDNQVSEKIPILRGVRQEDPISPKLFTATIQEVFKMLSYRRKEYYRWRKLSDLRFADDVALTTERVKDMERQ